MPTTPADQAPFGADAVQNQLENAPAYDQQTHNRQRIDQVLDTLSPGKYQKNDHIHGHRQKAKKEEGHSVEDQLHRTGKRQK